MIEKLPENKDKIFKTETGEYLTIPELSIPKQVSDKINELVDAVNELQKNSTISKMEKVETSAENVQDKFAEQRLWIGKLCKFWNEDRSDDLVYSILYRIYPDDEAPYESIYLFYYTHCEPVKPDDDIIYKGE